ncbi:MAG: ribosome biogenesis GTPase Der [Phycisphaeraceae bacterium]|nr:MAG: ribosome biogenesis GTPase Der [Phycisphaeraceae bacterium]
MPLPRIAIVGRPNVGKSSLLNMLARANVSIVDPTPGVTRDRVSSVIELPAMEGEEDIPRLVEIIDTGGYGIYTAEGRSTNDVGEDLTRLKGPIEAQIAEAVRTADLILFVIDAQAGLTSLDETFAQLLRQESPKARKEGAAPAKILMVANKVDGDNWEAHGLEAAALGFGEPALVSALNKFRRRDFIETLCKELPERQADEPDADAVIDPEAPKEMKIALVGKRNAGKSTFVNALAGEERMIVSEIAGTTRDSVDVRFEIDGRSFIAIDTAGFRKRKSYEDQVEWYAAHRALRSVRRADVVLFIIDATQTISQVEKQLSKEIQDHFKPCVVVVNKWDLARGRPGRKGRPVTTADFQEYIEKELKGLSRSPIVFTSALEGQGVRDAISIAIELFEQACTRLSTGRINRVMRAILEARGPTSKLGTQAKILYTTQVSTQPPTIVLVVNHEPLFAPGYIRYLLNRLAEMTPFEEVPIRLIIRDRKRARLEDLLAGDHKLADNAPPPKPRMPRVVHGLADDIPEEETDPEALRRLRSFKDGR